MSQTKAPDSGQRDLQHFLKLALAQLQSRLRKGAATPEESNRMRMLEELIKEQTGEGAAG